jgi:hypothetical protein
MQFSEKELQKRAELLFSNACSERDYRAEKIPERGDSQTPDFLVHTPMGDFVAEVKSPGRSEQIKKQKGQESAVLTLKPGHHVRKLLTEASSQLASYRPELPCVLVICDLRHNLPDYPVYPLYGFNSAYIADGMFGETKYVFERTSNQGGFVSKGPRLGGNRTLRRDEKTHVSAVLLLLCHAADSPAGIFVYHNPFAAHSFPVSLMRSPIDRHHRLVIENDQLQKKWEEFA